MITKVICYIGFSLYNSMKKSSKDCLEGLENLEKLANFIMPNL